MTDPYDFFAPYYDAINEEPSERIALILSYLEDHHPTARRILELGCGTGAVLAGLGSGYELVGVDRSSGMLEVARRRVPTAMFHQHDIATVQLDETFDVVLCVCDTINHVTTTEGWQQVIERAASHLEPGGLFILDFNTRGRFLDVADSTPWAHDVDDNTLVMWCEFEEPLATWHLRLFERLSDDQFRRHDTRITELSVPTSIVLDMLGNFFELVTTSDTEGGIANDASHRGVIVARRLAR